MIRIDIEWQFVSPVLQRASGILKVHNISWPGGEGNGDSELFSCTCYIENNCSGFKSIQGKKSIPSNLFRCVEEQVNLMMRSYFDGLTLQNKCYHWVEESLDSNKFDFDKWVEKYQTDKK